MVILPFFPGSAIWRFMRRLFAMTFSSTWHGPGPFGPTGDSPLDASVSRQIPGERPVSGLEDDLILATWEDAEWQ